MNKSHAARLEAIFRAELRERLVAMREHLMGLRAVDDPVRRRELVESCSREAHSVRGGAALIGWDGVEELAAAIERHLAPERSGAGPTVDPDIVLKLVEGIGHLADRPVPSESLDALGRRLEGSRSPDPGRAPDEGGRGRNDALRWRDPHAPRVVLLVEDQPVNRELVRAILNRGANMVGRCTILEAPTLAAARAILASVTVDLVLLDLRLPDGDGLELARELEGRPDRPPILATSASAVAPEGPGAAAIDAVIAKPLDADRLLAAVVMLTG